MVETLITLPAPRAAICGARAAVKKNGARTFVANIDSKSSTAKLSVGPNEKLPALFTRMSMPWPLFSPSAASSLTLSSAARSARTNRAEPPSPRIAATTSEPRRSSRPDTTTSAPSRANASAVARPIPDVLPVTSATFPASRMTISFLSSTSAVGDVLQQEPADVRCDFGVVLLEREVAGVEQVDLGVPDVASEGGRAVDCE